MKRLALVMLFLVLGCSSVPQNQTIRHPQMNYLEFIARADRMVKNSFPEWHVEGTPIEVSFKQGATIRFASTGKLPDGRFVIEIYEAGWDLAIVEDLASVLLHEYVHIKIWDRLKEAIPDSWCRVAIHELTAYGVELNQYRINVTQDMRASNKIGYDRAYANTRIYCSSKIIEEFSIPQDFNLRVL